MISILGACAVVALGFGTAALAADDPVASAYGNTVLATNEKGETTKTWYKADHTFTGVDSKGQKFQGTWTLAENNTKFCENKGIIKMLTTTANTLYLKRFHHLFSS